MTIETMSSPKNVAGEMLTKAANTTANHGENLSDVESVEVNYIDIRQILRRTNLLFLSSVPCAWRTWTLMTSTFSLVAVNIKCVDSVGIG